MSYKFFSHKATLQSQVSVRPSAKPLSLLESCLCLSAKSQSIGHYANQLSAISSFFVPLFARDFFPLDLNLNQRPTSPSHQPLLMCSTGKRRQWMRHKLTIRNSLTLVPVLRTTISPSPSRSKSILSKA